MRFRHGWSYLAGFDYPTLLSEATIRRGVERRGFKVHGAWSCEEWRWGLPADVGACGDDWDYIALVTRTGPDEEIDVPDRVKWIVPLTPTPQAPWAPQPTDAWVAPPPTQGSIWWPLAMVAGVATLAYFVSR